MKEFDRQFFMDIRRHILGMLAVIDRKLRDNPEVIKRCSKCNRHHDSKKMCQDLTS